MTLILLAWSFRVFLPAGEVQNIFAMDDRVVLAVQGGILVMDTLGNVQTGVPTPTPPVMAVLAPNGLNLFWVDTEGDLYRSDLQSLQSIRLVHVGEGHSLATDGRRVFFATLSDRVITLDVAGFPRHEPRPRSLVWSGLWGQIPESHPGRVLLDPVRTRISFYAPWRDRAWVVEDSGVVMIDLQTGMRKAYGFPVPPVYPLAGAFLRPSPGVYGEGGVALLTNEKRWRWIIPGERVVAACPPDRYLTPFFLLLWKGGFPQQFPLNGGPFERMACGDQALWVGGPDGVWKVGKGLMLSVRVRDLAWNGTLWVASTAGLFVLRDTVWERLQDTAGILSGEVVDLDARGDTVVASSPFGAVLWDEEGRLRILSRHPVERMALTHSDPVGYDGLQLITLRPEGPVPIYAPVNLRDVVDLKANGDSLIATTPRGLWLFVR